MQLLLIDGNHIMYSVLFRHIAKAKKRGDYETDEATERIVDKACKQFTGTIRKLVRRFRPTHMCVIFDNDAQNFRHRLSPIYKANRKERPKEVHPLKQRIYQTFRTEGIPYMYASDYEGDDLLGTIARRAEESPRCRRVVLLSGDMDLAQLITQRTHLYLITTGIFTGTWVTLDNVKEHVQVMPEQLPNIKALLGDRTDNIKGISGLRRPNALRVVETYADLTDFFEKGQSRNKTESLILRHREHVMNNLELARIRCDLRFQLRWDDYRVSTWFGTGAGRSSQERDVEELDAEEREDTRPQASAATTTDANEPPTKKKRRRRRRSKRPTTTSEATSNE